MSIKIQNICTKKQYESQGETKTVWRTVGELKTLDDGKQFIELYANPAQSLFVFDRKVKEEAF